MLTNQKISITAKTVVNDAEIASHGAVLDVESGELSFFTRQLDKEACKLNREIVRADTAEFEDFAYSIQESTRPATTESND